MCGKPLMACLMFFSWLDEVMHFGRSHRSDVCPSQGSPPGDVTSVCLIKACHVNLDHLVSGVSARFLQNFSLHNCYVVPCGRYSEMTQASGFSPSFCPLRLDPSVDLACSRNSCDVGLKGILYLQGPLFPPLYRWGHCAQVCNGTCPRSYCY